jgi:hypothetical protein
MSMATENFDAIYGSADFDFLRVTLKIGGKEIAAVRSPVSATMGADENGVRTGAGATIRFKESDLPAQLQFPDGSYFDLKEASGWIKYRANGLTNTGGVLRFEQSEGMT